MVHLPARPRGVQAAHRALWSVVRLATAGALLLTIPLIAGRPALVELGVVALVVTGALLIESVVHAESRRQIRAELAPH